MRKTALLMFSLLLALATVATAGNSKKRLSVYRTQTFACYFRKISG